MLEVRNNPNTGPGTETLCEGLRSPTSCSLDQQCGLGCHVTARKKLSKGIKLW